MTKKDYILIAESLNPMAAILRAKKELSKSEIEFAFNQTVNLLARKLQQDNSRFDFDRFIEAVNK